jgi:hypothetical protein
MFTNLSFCAGWKLSVADWESAVAGVGVAGVFV